MNSRSIDTGLCLYLWRQLDCPHRQAHKPEFPTNGVHSSITPTLTGGYPHVVHRSPDRHGCSTGRIGQRSVQHLASCQRAFSFWENPIPSQTAQQNYCRRIFAFEAPSKSSQAIARCSLRRSPLLRRSSTGPPGSVPGSPLKANCLSLPLERRLPALRSFPTSNGFAAAQSVWQVRSLPG